MATGSLPPVVKSTPQSCPPDMSRFSTTKRSIVSSNKELNPVLGTAVACKVEEARTRRLYYPGQPLNVNKPRSLGFNNMNPRLIAVSKPYEKRELVIKNSGTVCKPMVENRAMTREPESQLCVTNSKPSFDNGCFDRDNKDKDLGTPLTLKASPHYTLCYQPSRPAKTIAVDAEPSCEQREQNSSPIASPASFFTPPRVKTNISSLLSPESVLKMAAMSFPNTPSILRKRNSRTQVASLSNKKARVDREPEGDIAGASQEPHGIMNNSEMLGSRGRSVLDSPASIADNGKAFNASPPYRIRSKRTAVFKSVEKQLAFTFDKELEPEKIKSVDFPVQATSSVPEDFSHSTKMGVTENLAGKFSYCFRHT